MPLPDSEIERALVVVAHPDDVDFGSAGTIAQWTDRGIKVSYCLLTRGDAGGFDPDVPRERIAGIREAEQRAAAAELGVEDVVFLGYPDGRLTVDLGLRRDITREIRRVRPQRLVCQAPVRNFERIPVSHPDHLAAGEAAMCAVYPDARNPFAHPELAAEGLEAWTVREVWIAGMQQPNHYVDVTDTFERKKEALRRHESQMAGLTRDLDEMLRDWMGLTARRGGLPEGRLAEAYHVMDVG